MSNRYLPRLFAGLVSTALVLAGVSLATPAAAATTAPPWEPDQNSVGTLSFYDAKGNVVTSGNDLSHLFDYAVAGTDADRPTTKATLYFGFPDHSQADSIQWFSSAASSTTKYPNASAPAPLDTKTSPVVSVAINEANLQSQLSTTTLDQTDGYKDLVQIRLRDSGPGNPVQDQFWTADIHFDKTANTWNQVFPAPAQAGVPAAPTAVQATAGDGSATVTWTAPASDGGSAITGYVVQYSSDDGGSWTSAPSSTSTATTRTVTGLTNGTSYVFRVAATNASGQSDYSTPSNAVAPKAADPSALTIGAPATVRYKAAAAVTGTLTDATTKAAIASAPVTLYRRASSTATWAKVKTVTTSTKGAVSTSVALTANTQFQWRYAGNAAHRAVTSATKSVAVTQTITAARTPATVKHGASVKVYGTVAPAGTGQTVSLQKRTGTKWVTQKGSATIKKQKLPNGKTAVGFVFTVKLATKGTFTYRVYKAATKVLAAGYSSSLTVRAT